LPPAATTIPVQVARRHAEIALLNDDLQKYLVLSDLHRRNETLFYAPPFVHLSAIGAPSSGALLNRIFA
jgi:hypothetical protein